MASPSGRATHTQARNIPAVMGPLPTPRASTRPMPAMAPRVSRNRVRPKSLPDRPNAAASAIMASLGAVRRPLPTRSRIRLAPTRTGVKVSR